MQESISQEDTTKALLFMTAGLTHIESADETVM